MKIIRALVVVALFGLAEAAFGSAAAQTAAPPGVPPDKTREEPKALHDFDFLVGDWRVHHRKLKVRLANNHEWVEFEGTLSSQPLMGGYSNVDDLVLNVPGSPYRGVALRSFDPESQQWSIWWLDSRTPLGPLDPPMRGGFKDGLGTFYGDDTLNGKQVRARFIWSDITPTSCHWEQAYSPDGGKTWETNWVQDIRRAP
jgi:Protein of unknown function (DUF1579)